MKYPELIAMHTEDLAQERLAELPDGGPGEDRLR